MNQEAKTVESNKWNKETKSILYVISFLLPIIGIIAGAIALNKNEQEAGRNLFLFSFAGFIVNWIIIGIIFAQAEQQFYSDMEQINRTYSNDMNKAMQRLELDMKAQ